MLGSKRKILALGMYISCCLCQFHLHLGANANAVFSGIWAYDYDVPYKIESDYVFTEIHVIFGTDHTLHLKGLLYNHSCTAKFVGKNCDKLFTLFILIYIIVIAKDFRN